MKNVGRCPLPVMPAAVAVALVTGCAATPEAPHQALARAEASIESAQQAGAREVGAEQLDAAREKLTQARAAVDRGEMVEAERNAEQAELDAELAAAIARNSKAQASVNEVKESIDLLREEIARNQDRALTGERQ